MTNDWSLRSAPRAPRPGLCALPLACAWALACGSEAGGPTTADAPTTDAPATDAGSGGEPTSATSGSSGATDEAVTTSGTSDVGTTSTTDPPAPGPTTGPDTTEPAGCAVGDGTFAVSEVQGAVQDGLTIVVCGDGFGDLGPTILLFDDMEGGQADAPLAAEAPAIGAWTEPRGQYVGDASRSGSLAMLFADTAITEGGGVSAVVGLPDRAGPLGLRLFDEVFLSLAIRDLGDFPGNNSSPTQFSSDSSAKDVWMMFGDRGDNYEYSCQQGQCNGHDFVFATHTGGGSFKHDGNNTPSSWWLPGFWQFQAWNVMSTYIRIDPDDPYGAAHGVFEHFSPAGGYVRDEYTSTILADLADIPPAWDRLKFGAWYRKAGQVRRVADDIYVAIGPGAAARVEIADAAQIEDATKLAISTAHAWSANQIEATVRLGDLDPQTDDLYLFVVTADGVRSPGYPLN